MKPSLPATRAPKTADWRPCIKPNLLKSANSPEEELKRGIRVYPQKGGYLGLFEPIPEEETPAPRRTVQQILCALRSNTFRQRRFSLVMKALARAPRQAPELISSLKPPVKAIPSSARFFVSSPLIRAYSHEEMARSGDFTEKPQNVPRNLICRAIDDTNRRKKPASSVELTQTTLLSALPQPLTTRSSFLHLPPNRQPPPRRN